MQLDLCREKHEWTLREQVVLMCVRGTIRTGTDVYAAESSAGQAEQQSEHAHTNTSAKISGKDKQPSSIQQVARDLLTMRGLTSTLSEPESGDPSGLYTMRRAFTPTCGAARPMPSVLYMISNMPRASCSRFSSKCLMRLFSWRSVALGYFSIFSGSEYSSFSTALHQGGYKDIRVDVPFL